MKNKLMPLWDKMILRKLYIIECMVVSYKSVSPFFLIFVFENNKEMNK